MSATTALRLLIFIPVLSFPLLYLIGRSTLRISTRKGKPCNPSRWLALGVMFAMLIPLFFGIQSFLAEGAFSTTIGNIELRMDGISIIVQERAITIPITT